MFCDHHQIVTVRSDVHAAFLPFFYARPAKGVVGNVFGNQGCCGWQVRPRVSQEFFQFLFSSRTLGGLG